ncbi:MULTISPECIES: hypothetical protein [Sphingobacterium]|uniref:hypothetical protein n=1 Tax=Sphingobacterium TaxID=28453 RepID=UPI00257F75CB|nr:MULTISPECIES: hypothetical protein [Sphingobacterium]
MDKKKELLKLREMGFTYLIKMKGTNSFRPLRGNYEQANQFATSLPTSNNEILAIADALSLADQGFEYEETICFDWTLTNLI